MGIEISNSGGGITVELDPNAVPLAGGTMTGNLIIDAGGGTHAQVDPTEVFTTRTDAGEGESNAYGALYNGGVEVGDIDGKYAVLTPNRLRLGNTTSLEKGSFDSGRGGDFGISLICTNNVELNWQSGYLKAKYNGSFVPINVESDIVNSTIPDIDNQGTKSIFNSDGLSAIFYTGSENTYITNYGHSGIDHELFDNSNNFHLNAGGVSGVGGTGGDNWGLGSGGVSGGNDNGQSWSLGINGLSGANADDYPSDTSFSLNSSKVVGHKDAIEGEEETIPAKDWEFGVDGLKFVDGSVQTTAGLGIDPAEGGINFEATNTYGGMRVSWIEQTGDGRPSWKRAGAGVASELRYPTSGMRGVQRILPRE
jgi:hypothetical protein